MGRYRYDLAFVLGGGGARGLAHIGVIRELLRNDIRPDLIVGTSMGAVIGGMYSQCLDIDVVEGKISKFVEEFGRRGRWLSFLGELDSRTKEDLLHDITYYIKKHYMKIKAFASLSLEEKKLLFEPLSEFFAEDIIENCRIPFAAVSIDLWGGAQKVLSSGPIIEAVYASAAVQGVFPPLEYENMYLSDGGPVSLVPVRAARELGARRVIAVDVSMKLKRDDSITTGLQVILRSDSVSQERLKRIELVDADLVICPGIHSVHWANFGRVRYCVKKGEIAARKALESRGRAGFVKPWWKKIALFSK